MININPLEYPALIKRTFKVAAISPDKTKIQINMTANNIRLYYGKPMIFFIGDTKYVGTYHVNNVKDVTHYIFLDKPAIGLTVDSEVTLFETFTIKGDNQAITFQDAYEKLIATESEVSEFGETNIGNSGLLTGLQNLKLNHQIYDFKKDTNIELSNSFTTVCDLRIPSDNKTLNRYRIWLSDSAVSKTLFDLELVVSYGGTFVSAKLNSHMLQQSNQDEYKSIKNNIVLKLQNTNYSNGESFVTVNIGLRLNNNISEVYNFAGYIGCKDASDLITPEVSVIDSVPILLNGKELINCDKTLLSIDTYGEKRTSYWKETIFQGSELTKTTLISDQTPGHYVINGSIPEDVPGGIKDMSLTGPNKDIKFVIDWSKGNLVIYPNKDIEGNPKDELNANTCMLVTNNRRIFIGLINRTGNTINWSELVSGTHIHYAKDIITDATHLFVTQVEKDSWNKAIGDISDNPWRPVVQTETDLPKTPAKGYTVTVMQSTVFGGLPVVYQFANNVWKPISINVIPVMATTDTQTQYTNGGTLVDRDFIDKVDSLGIGYQLSNGKEQFVSIINPKNIYSVSENRFFDLVKRVTNNNNPLNKSINIGFDNAVSTDNAISIGSDITDIAPNGVNYGIGLIGKENTTVIGRYNENIPEALFNLGIGTGPTTRKSVLIIDNSNNLIIKQNNGYFKLEKYGPEMFLTSGGVLAVREFVKRQEFLDALEKKADRNKFGFFKHETFDGSYLEPIVFISGLYQEYKKYDV